jgi:DNA polymerase III epsilon subunit-like protein
MSSPSDAAPAKSAERVATAWAGLRLVVVDTETTGLSASDRVISVALLTVTQGRIQPRPYYELLDLPDQEFIGGWDIHKLTKDDLRGQDTFEMQAGAIESYLRGDGKAYRTYLCGHNVAFDAHFLQAEFVRTGAVMQHLPLLDTMTLARHAGVTLADQSLSARLAALDLANPDAHSALMDATMTASAAIKLIKLLAERQEVVWDDLIDNRDLSDLTLDQASGRRRGRKQAFPPLVLDEEHAAAHATRLTDKTAREKAFGVCLDKSCPVIAGRLAAGVTDPATARDIIDFATRQLRRRTNLDTHTRARLADGAARLVRDVGDPEYARELYTKLVRLIGKGVCPEDDRCSRCERGEQCHYAHARSRLVGYYLGGAQRPDIVRVIEFLPVPVPGQKRTAGRPETGWWGKLSRAGDKDAAGYGAALAARARWKAKQKAEALRTCEIAWRAGCRNPVLAEQYALILEADPKPASKPRSIARAIEVVDAALTLRGNQESVLWDDLIKRAARLRARQARPVRIAPTTHINTRPVAERRFTLR